MDVETLFRQMVRIIAAVENIRGDYHPEPGGHVTFSFQNNSGRDLAVIDRNNDVQIIPQALGGSDLSNPGLRIKIIRYNISFNAATQTAQALGIILKAIGRTNPSLESSLLCARTANKDEYGRYYTERAVTVPIDAILNNAGVLEENTGLVVIPLELIGRISHPDSIVSREFGKNKDYVKGRPSGRLIEIVDNNSVYKERFTFMSNEVVRIPSIRDTDRVEGVHVSYVRDVGRTVSHLETKHYSFEEGFKRFGLFGTREEAENSGNPGLAMQAKLEEMERENRLLSSQLKQEELRHAKDLAEAKRELESRSLAITAEESELKRQERLGALAHAEEAARMKSITSSLEDQARRNRITEEAQHASYSSSLKSTADTYKWMPAIVAGTLAVGAAIAAFIFR